MNVHTRIQYILIGIVFVILVVFSRGAYKDTLSGAGGYFDISDPASATLTGYNWLQLNQTSNNKIQLFSGQARVESPNFNWGGETVATRDWVSDELDSLSFVTWVNISTSSRGRYFYTQDPYGTPQWEYLTHIYALSYSYG